MGILHSGDSALPRTSQRRVRPLFNHRLDFLLERRLTKMTGTSTVQSEQSIRRRFGRPRPQWRQSVRQVFRTWAVIVRLGFPNGWRSVRQWGVGRHIIAKRRMIRHSHGDRRQTGCHFIGKKYNLFFKNNSQRYIKTSINFACFDFIHKIIQLFRFAMWIINGLSGRPWPVNFHHRSSLLALPS